MIIKTLERTEAIIEDQIRELSSYDTPAIIKLTGKVNEEFLAWMEKNIV